ncbi:histidine kinase [Bacteroides luti]|uniref:histidine kinase n=1 Tax=Bacteroides luti TaxID=1297750 RepID=A0A1M4Y0B0_9BACE|nr:ATP-binding protein [Bacteroides luti]SHE99125.1 histidine kinase [Bacteroides luti]
MSEILKEKHFNPKAHILTLLGDELIKNPVMAIYELVKNSYDADATKVDVRFRDIEDTDKAVIIIEDDGIGMTSEVIENVWLEPGTDFKKPYNKETGKREIIKSPIYKRVPMGEKGVGRFAVHKLSSQILLITRPTIIVFKENSREIENTYLADYEIQLFIDWLDFNQSIHLSDVPIKWKIKKDSDTFRFKNSSGTYIRLSNLKEAWTRGMAREIKGQTLSMLSPRMGDNNFKINLNFDNNWIENFPDNQTIINEAPYKVTAFVDSEYNLTFEYVFSLKNNTKIGKRTIKEDKSYNRNIKGFIRPIIRKNLETEGYDKNSIEKKLEEFDSINTLLPFGDLFIEFYSFDLDTLSMRDYSSDIAATKRILKEHAGIKVYKGDLRVYDYGEKGNDWLGIDLERVQNTEWFSNNQNIGYVYLDSNNSNCLIEKTNREGFIRNNSYDIFYTVVKWILSEIKTTRLVDRSKWIQFNKKSSNNLFDEKVNNFKSIINNIDLNDADKRKFLLEEVERLEQKYEDDKKVLLIPAGVGMTASFALHEIEKLVPRMQNSVKQTPFSKDIIIDQVEELKQYVDGIISVLRKGGETPINVKDVVEKAFSNYRMKLADRKINYLINIDTLINNLSCERRLLITVLMNIIDNSIYWLDTSYKDNKLILLKGLLIDGKTTLVIADNGPGFKDDISDLIRPFFTRKVDGIGIGLYLIDTIMLKYGKFEIVQDINEKSQLGIPAEYDGAIVKLTFNK